MATPIANLALTMFLVTLHGEFDPETVLDGPVVVDDEDERMVISAADPNALEKLSAHPAVATVERIGQAAMIVDWMGSETLADDQG